MVLGGDPFIGKEIGGAYRITARINCGAFGCVYQAQHIFFEEDPIVAIKLLQGLVVSEEDRQHFIQEALQAYEAALRLNPNKALPYYGKGVALERLKRKSEAQLAFDTAKELGYKG